MVRMRSKATVFSLAVLGALQLARASEKTEQQQPDADACAVCDSL